MYVTQISTSFRGISITLKEIIPIFKKVKMPMQILKAEHHVS